MDDCYMYMYFVPSTTDVCFLFNGLHLRSYGEYVLACAIIILFGIGREVVNTYRMVQKIHSKERAVSAAAAANAGANAAEGAGSIGLLHSGGQGGDFTDGSSGEEKALSSKPLLQSVGGVGGSNNSAQARPQLFINTGNNNNNNSGINVHGSTGSGSTATSVTTNIDVQQQQRIAEQEQVPVLLAMSDIVLDALLYTISLCMGYILMLVVMSYSVGLFCSTVVGCGIGHLGSSLYLDRYAARRAVQQHKLRMKKLQMQARGGACVSSNIHSDCSTGSSDYGSSASSYVPVDQCQTPCKC